MESPGSNANNSPVVSEASSKSLEEKTSPSEDPVVSQPSDGSHQTDQDREYGCKYCHKKFTNKQALGGHQNAHKVERAVEKSTRELHENHFGYFSGGSSYPGMSSTPLLGPYNRSHEFMNRAIIDRPYGHQHPVQRGVYIGYNGRPLLPMAGEPSYGGPRPLIGFNNGYSGWAGSPPRIPQFNAHSSYIQNHRFSTMGVGSSSVRPVSEDVSPFAGSRSRSYRNHRGENISQMNDRENQQLEDSDLDLSLKL